jgi:hypothetical protein
MPNNSGGGMESLILERRSDEYLSDSFLDRVRRSYKLALATSNDHQGRLWGEIDQRRAPVHAALLADTNDDLRQIFANPAASDLFIGIDYLRRNVLEDTPPPHAFMAGSTLGNSTVREHLKLAAGRIFALLPPTLQTVPFPNPFPDEVGLQTSTGIASYRAIQTVYQASLIRSAVDSCKNKSVIEIGPGMGRAAYYARHLGITDYTTIDLPLGIVAQACFLGATLGPDGIWMPGDELPADGRIKLLVAGQKPDRMFGVAFNSDSMTEMSMPAAMDYLDWLRQHCERFVSANRGDNLFTVADLARKWFAIADRRPYPVEPGYTEEVFIPRKSSGVMAWHRVGLHLAKLVVKRGPRRAINSLYRRAQNRMHRAVGR